MDDIPEPNPEQNELSSQAGQAKSAANEHTAKEIRRWDKNRLAPWLKLKLSTTLGPTDVKKILEAAISGSVFLRGAGNKEFFQSAGLSFGVSVELAELAREIKKKDSEQAGDTGVSEVLASLGDEVKEGGNLLNQTADGKRKVDSGQAGLAEPSGAASKKRRLDSEIDAGLLELAKRARERRDHIREKIATLGQLSDNADQLPNAADQLPNAADQLPNAADQLPNAAGQLANAADQLPNAADQLSNAAVQLSNPAFHDILPFPFVGPAVPTRFRANADSEDNWFYVGREMFMGLLDRLRRVQKARNRTALWVYGTKGYGKSHLLAALVCYLTAKGERVIYIPDCRECVRSPVEYVQAAMLFTWADNKATQDEIITLDSQKKIRKFLKRHPNLTFFIDQVNGFKGQDEVKRWLDSCRAWNKAVPSTSANYDSYLKTAPQQSTEETCYVYNGFTPAEVEQWWNRNKDVARGDYTKAEVEDFTGCIPLLLDMCVVDKKINLRVPTMKSIWNEVASFVLNLKEKAAPEAWEIYQKYVDACIERKPVPAGVRPELIDHRYFYEEENVGSYACGIAREAVAGQLRLHGRNRFGNTALQSLDDYISNESVVRFFIKQAILQTIEFRGLEMINEISRPMKMIPFKGYPVFDTSNELALYVPCNFNYYAIDGIILRLDHSSGRNRERKKAILFPLQITIAKSHKNSEEHFFNQWKKWTASLKNFDIEVIFLWISIENPSHTNLDESSRTLRDKDMTIHPPYTSRWIHLEEVNKDVWNRYSEALNNKMMPNPKLAVLEGQASRTSKEQGDAGEQAVAEEDQRAVEGQRAAEEQGGVEKQMRLDVPSAAAGPSGGEARRSRGSGGSRSGGRGGIRSDDRKVYQSRTVAELRLELKSRVLLQAGKKEELINRLMEHDRTRGTSRQ